MNRNVYLIPGLGADRRMYLHQLKVLPDAEVLEFVPPNKGESISDYAKRMSARIDTTHPFVLIGVSLGGMLAIEMLRWVNPEKVILIASAKNRQELPLFMRAMKYLKFHRLISGRGYKRLNRLVAGRLSGRQEGETATLIKAMLLDANNNFIEWAVNQVVNWSPKAIEHPVIYHIHGTSDRLLPIKNIKNPIRVEGGSHVMNMTRSAEINSLILGILEEGD